MADNYFAHQELIKKNKLLLTKQFPKALRIFDRTIGLFYRRQAGGGIVDYVPIKIGKNGQCDVYGALTCYHWQLAHIKIPVHVEMEFKTGKGELTPDQLVWKQFCESMGWVYILVREETNVAAEITKAINNMGLKICA